MNLWGAWRPDVSGPGSGFAEIAEGVIPQSVAGGLGYGPFPQLVMTPGAGALSADHRGLVSVQKFDSTWTQFAATATTIAQLQSDYTWSNIETGRTVTPDYDVSFLHFGSYLLNSDSTDGFKAYNVETPAGNNAVSGAPAAANIFSCNNVVFALNCDGDNRKMRSSGIGDHTDWKGKGANGKVFEDGGELICGGDLQNGLGIILQEGASRLITFGQGPGLYGLSKIGDSPGCVGAPTFAAFNGAAFWWDTNGPWMFSRGGGAEPIGLEKMVRWAESDIGPTNYRDMQATVDPARSLVMWRVDATRLLVYNWLVKEWSVVPAATSAVSRIATPAISIDNVTDQIDTVEIAFDSRYWAGGAPLLAALDGNRKFALFSGSNSGIRLRGSNFNSPSAGLINWAQLIDDFALGTLTPYYADDLATTMTPGTAAVRVSGGWVPLRVRGTVLQFERIVPAGSQGSFLSGLDNIGKTRPPR